MAVLSAEERAKVLEAVKRRKARNILVQMPEGLKTKALEIADEIEALARGLSAVVFADPCYGACDIPYHEALDLGCDLIVHIGHAAFEDSGTKTKIPVVYLEHPSADDPVPLLRREICKLDGYTKIGLLAPVQQVKNLPAVKKFLEGAGKKVVIGPRPKSGGASKTKYDGQVLGCDVSSAKKLEPKIDCYLYVGGGLFHPLGLLKITEKPLFVCDVERHTIEDITHERVILEKRRLMKQAAFKGAYRVGLLISTKSGQLNKGWQEHKHHIESLGKKVVVIAMNEIQQDKILGLKLDVLVNTACPRIEDDLTFSVPIINIGEAIAAAGAVGGAKNTR